jgi:epoxide hydrolase-like predicted phosphatase
MERAFDTVLFDFGGVYIGSPFPSFVNEAESLGVAPDRLIELTFGPMEVDGDHPWHRVERGELDMLGARTEIMALCKEAGLEIDPFVLLARSMAPHSEGHPEVVACTRELRSAGYRTGLVTNNALEIRERWRAVLPLDELFDVVVDSSEVGMRKPAPGIYELALERLEGATAERTLFLDDLPANVRGAEDVGMRGILVATDPVPALTELRMLTGIG